MKILVAVLGASLSVEVSEGANAQDALNAFERLTGKVLGSMDVYNSGTKVTDLSQPLKDGAELTAVKSKHESAATITLKVLGAEFSVTCDDNTGCSEAYEVFERVTKKAIKGMDLYKNGSKMVETDTLQDGDEVVAIKSKHESAGTNITLERKSAEQCKECDDDSGCDEAMETFERVTGKALKGMDFYRNGSKVTANDTFQEGDEVVAIKSKHESAS